MGRRSRKRREGGAPGEAVSGRQTMERGYARARERDERLRAQLEPLGPGERPRPLLVAIAVAAALGAVNVAFLLAGVEVSGEQPSAFGVVLLSLLMFVAAAGMWARRYWAVLGFQALLALTVVFAALSLMVASNVLGALLSLAVIGLAGWLFWRLVRVMARLQVPRRGTGDANR